jgi:hypothetical protein
MIRWVVAIFVVLAVFYPLWPWLARLGIGRMPGDVCFRVQRVVFCLPFGSTVLWSALAFLFAKLLQ